MDQNREGSFYSNEYNSSNLEIPIVGYEIMEERARFTVWFIINTIRNRFICDWIKGVQIKDRK